MIKQISVALPVVVNSLFDYKIDAVTSDSLIGRRVLVPFGKSRKLIGVILAESEYKEAEGDASLELKQALKLIDETPVFSKNMINLLKWMSDYYIAPIGEVFKIALPSTQKQETNKVVKLLVYNTDSIADLIKNRKSLNTIIDILINNDNSIEYNVLKKSIRSNLNQKLKDLADLEIIEIIEQEPKATKIKTKSSVRIHPLLAEDSEFLNKELETLEKRSPKRYTLIKYLIDNNGLSDYIDTEHIIATIGVSKSTITSLIKNEYLEDRLIQVDTFNDGDFKLASKKEVELKLSDVQESVFQALLNKYHVKDLKPSLLYGVTGSGKTLIYMNLIKEVLKNGQSTIILLPEISLTPQLIDRFELSFPGQISVIHSRMPAGAREKSYQDIESGKSKIVIGARSALFAPTENLGLIIVDEEHDSSYKQESPVPRYHGRDAAVMRAKLESCSIVLGSATPSIESMYNAQIGKYDLYSILQRVDNASLPNINVIDIFDAKYQMQNYNALSTTLLSEIHKRLVNKESIILLQNRRGFASVVQCEDCQQVVQCDNCNVSLTYHKHDNLCKCHYCDFTTPIVKTCKYCGSNNLTIHGYGTQKIEEDIEAYFSGLNIQCKVDRMDLDTTSRQGAHRKILERFSKGETNVLIGTQMVAKGLDFQRVTMVGIVNADIQLLLPDFRSNERTFQLLTQVAGRAGRGGDTKGEVFIQTSNPNNPVIKSVLSSSYEQFYKEEVHSREIAQYPPFTRFNVIEFSGMDKSLVELQAITFFNLLKTHKSLIINRPVSPFIDKIRDNYRKIIVIKSIKSLDPTAKILHDVINIALIKYNKDYASDKIKLKIDIDANSGL